MQVPYYRRDDVTVSNPTVRLQAPGDANSFGAGVGQAMSGTGQAIQQLGNELNTEQVNAQAKLNQTAVLNATTNMYNDWLPKYSDLMDRKGLNALGQAATDTTPVMPSVTQEGTQFLTDLKNKYSGTLANDVQKQVFNQIFQRDFPNYQKLLYEHERQQADIAAQDSQNAHMDTLKNQFSVFAKAGNVAQADAALRNANADMTAFGKIHGWGQDVTNDNLGKWNDNTIASAIVSLAQDSPTLAQQIADRYSDKLSANAQSLVQATLRPIVERDKIFNAVQTVKANPSYYINGVLDLNKALEDGKPLFTKSRTVGSPVGKDAFIDAIAGQESGGNYGAVNGRTGASGKYQIMPANWPSWAQEAGLSSDAPMTPDNQEKVARFKLGQYYDAYGPEGAAMAWYAGPDSVNWSNEAKNRKQGNGDEPSVNDYVSSVMARIPKDTQTVQDFDTAGYEKYEQQMRAVYSDSVRIKNEQEKAYREDVSKQVWGAQSLSDAVNMIENANLLPAEKETLINQAKFRFKSLDPSANAVDKYFAKYENLGGLQKDLEYLREKSDLSASGQNPTPEQTTKYNMAMWRLGQYDNYKKSQGYLHPEMTHSQLQLEPDKSAGFTLMDTFGKEAPSSQAEPGKTKITQDEYNYLLRSGKTPAEINAEAYVGD